MANHYGTRYLEVDQFIKYCKDLRVETDERELEYYEKAGIMLPLMRVIYPKDYITLRSLWLSGKSNNPPDLSEWEGLANVFDKNRILPKDYADITEEEFIDSFDRELGKTPYLSRPSIDTYIPWKEYKIQIESPVGNNITAKFSDHYYAYWQVYQLAYIQKYPDLWRNKPLLDLIPLDKQKSLFRPLAPDLDKLQNFDGLAKVFDVLSFWITTYHRTKLNAFALIPEIHKIKRLDDLQYQNFLNRIKKNANLVQSTFSVTADDLYAFLYRLLVLRASYLENEKIKLADELRNDVIYFAYFIQALTGAEWDSIAEGLRERKYPFWVREHFRHLDTLVKERDEAFDFIKSVIGNYTKKIDSLGMPIFAWRISTEEVKDFLDYCINEGLSLFVTSASGMIASEEDYTRKFRRVLMYTNIKNIVTSFEYLLRSFIAKGNLTNSGSGLNSAIKSVMERRVGWFSLFDSKKNFAKASNSNEFYEKLIDLINDNNFLESEENHWARVFLIASLARNLTVHENPKDDWFYGELFEEMLTATIYAMLYSWKLAKKEDWIK